MLILEYILSFPANAILCSELRHGVQFYRENFQEFIELKAKGRKKIRKCSALLLYTYEI